MLLSNWHALRSILRFTNREASRPDHRSAELRTRYLALDRRDAWRHVQACIEQFDRQWQMLEETVASGQIHLTRKVLLRWFTSDVSVTLWQADEKRVAVDVSSASRIGRMDFGQNARNVRDFYRSLEMYLRLLPAPGETTRKRIRPVPRRAVH